MFSRVINGTVSAVDVDGIVRRIDVDELVERIDLDRAIDQIDLDRVLDRIDINKVLEKIDVKEIMDRAEIGAIVARSTTDFMSPLVDAFRAQVVEVDQFVQGVGLCRKSAVPPAPGRVATEDRPKLPRGSANIAVAVQERYAGTAARTLAFAIDEFLLFGILYLLFLIIFEICNLILPEHAEINIMRYDSPWFFVGYYFWQFIYCTSAYSATGKTIGKAFLGLRVVNWEDGTPVSRKRAALRSLLQPFSVITLVGVVFGLIRSDRRELHDIIAGTGVVYHWDARMARYRNEKEGEAVELYTGFDDGSVTASIVKRTRRDESRVQKSKKGKRGRVFRRIKSRKPPPPPPVDDGEDSDAHTV